MADLKVNKMVVVKDTGSEIAFDLTGDTATESDIAKGKTAHNAAGEEITGTNTNDMDTSDLTATADEILAGKTAGVGGKVVEGAMVNNESVNGTISEIDEEYDIPAGYHDGGGKVSIDATEQAKLIPSNVRQGVTILGVEGEMTGSEDVKAQAKDVTPTFEEQVVIPDEDYNYLSQVNVKGIPVTYTENAAGGYTLTIGSTD